MKRPLTGLRVVELASLGPGPFACMLLADLGADVVRVVRPGSIEREQAGIHHTLRGRSVVEADLKDKGDVSDVRRLLSAADVLIEGFRPGVIERLGLSPDGLLDENPRLVIGRMTGWGQSGPWAGRAGHDINYLSLTGALHVMGPKDRPLQPLNFVADFGGGAMFLIAGVLAAIVQREHTGRGQVIDAAMVDGVSMFMQDIWQLRSEGSWVDGRMSNFNDGAAPYYRTYECADGGFVAVGAIEPQFYAELLAGLELESTELPDQNDRESWPELAQTIGAVFGRRTRADWEAKFEGTDACVTPVLTPGEVADHPHVAAREAVRNMRGVAVSNEAPRFSHSTRDQGGAGMNRQRSTDLPTLVGRWIYA